MKAIKRSAQNLKSSGIEWIGGIPVEHDIVRNKYLIKFVKGKIPKNQNIEHKGVPYVGASDLDNFEYSMYTEDTDLPMCIKDDVLILWDGARAGAVGFGKEGALSSTMVKCVFDKNELYPKFWYWYLKGFENFLLEQVHGTTIPHMSSRYVNEICLINWSLLDQKNIANYLDDRCSKIDAIIAEAKASIEEYKELKQAVITQAVTLGIKKNRPLKDTNILWIGKMPCDWQVAELKFFASIKSGITLGQKYPAGAKLVEMPYLRVANVQGEYVDLSDVKTIRVLPEEVEKYRLEAGVVLMTEGGDRDKLGRGCVWHGEIAPCLHQNHVFAVTTKSDKLLPEYFSHVTTSEVARCYFDYTAKKTTNLANTNSSTIMNFRLPIPPLEEQREIVQYLDKRIKTLNAMISEKQSLIEDLESYKKSLIYEVVTGKRKVVA